MRGFNRRTFLALGGVSAAGAAAAACSRDSSSASGSADIRAEDTEALDEHVWTPATSSQPWAAGGSYLTARRIAMNIEVWDTLQLQEQERVTGRDKFEGAPLTGTNEFDEPDFAATNERGRPVIDHGSHVFNVHPDQNGGIRMLRRAFNFVDGSNEQGRLDAGLFFIAFTRTVDRFATVHQSMSRDEMFLEYLKTTKTGTYLIPPGVGETGFVGEGMFA